MVRAAEQIITWQRDCEAIATNSVDFTHAYIAHITLGQGAGHAPVEVDDPFRLPHEVLRHGAAKQATLLLANQECHAHSAAAWAMILRLIVVPRPQQPKIEIRTRLLSADAQRIAMRYWR